MAPSSSFVVTSVVRLAASFFSKPDGSSVRATIDRIWCPHTREVHLTVACKEVDCVFLTRDIPEHALKSGEGGAIVWVHTPEEFEVEFVEPDGYAKALLTVHARDLRPATDVDHSDRRTRRRPRRRD